MTDLTKESVWKWKVLIVDDHPDGRELATFVLQSFGADVRSATNGVDGLNVMKAFSPTFVLLDLSMPVMDGWDMLKAIRADTGMTQTPVIALTAHAMRGDEARALEAGFDHYISKPFSVATFIDDLLRVFNSRPELVERVARAEASAPNIKSII